MRLLKTLFIVTIIIGLVACQKDHHTVAGYIESVHENLDFIARVFGMDRRKERMQQAIDQLGIGHARQKQLAGNLSGG